MSDRAVVRFVRPGPLAWGLATLWGGLIVGPGRASAQSLEHRLAARAELGVGTMLPEYQRERLRYDVVTQGTARGALSLIDPLAVQLSIGTWLGPSSAGLGQQVSFTGGLRFEPRIGTIGRPFVDLNAGLGLSGGLGRFTGDAGVGFEFALGRVVGLGPVVRYAHLFAAGSDYPSDAQMWSVGASLTLRVPPPEPAPRATPTAPTPPPVDTDRDGVLDPQDLCPTEPAGPHPDPARAGCPTRDTDRDGVLDPQDLCRDVPAGPHPDPERAGCPDGDTDSDGVLNHQDRCPNEHAGRYPDPARPGCPLPDRDHDSVPDATDACPDQPGAPSTDPRRNGCPGLVQIEEGFIRIARPVYFATGRDVILPRSRPVLRAVAEALRADNTLRRVAVEGYADDVADEAFNLDLSRRRAANVMAFLVQQGIDPARLSSQGYGESRPAVAATTAAARAANRRVEFRIVDPAPSSTPGLQPVLGPPTPPAAAPAASPAPTP